MSPVAWSGGVDKAVDTSGGTGGGNCSIIWYWWDAGAREVAGMLGDEGEGKGRSSLSSASK